MFRCLEILLDWYAETLKGLEQMTLPLAEYFLVTCTEFQSLPDGPSASISIVNPSGVNFQLEVFLPGTRISFIFGVSP